MPDAIPDLPGALAEYVGAPGVSDYINECAAEATDLVDAYVGAATVPTTIRRRAILEVGSELYHRQKAPNGISQFADGMGAPIRVARDPMVGAYPLLRQFVGGGFA